MRPLLQSLRPDQWLKNAFVLMPLVFAHQLLNGGLALKAVLYALCFCLVSSAVYLLNDVADAAGDRLHPVKKNRPVASGALSRRAALTASLVLGTAGLSLGAQFTSGATFLLALYAANNILYSFVLKRVVVLDVILIAVGFVLRVMGGAAAIGVSASVWLIMCTFLISLFLGFCKRKQELMVLQEKPGEHRSVLEHYNMNYLDHMISVVSACTVLSYALYTVAPETVSKFGTQRLIFSLPFVLFGVFRYMYHINVLKSPESTSEILRRDPLLIITMALWLATAVAIIYF